MSKQQQEIKFLEGPRSRWVDFKFVIKVCLEFVRGFRALHFTGPCVTVFGSARFKEDSQYYDLTRRFSAEAAKLGFSVAVIPKANAPKKPIEGMTVHAVERVEEAMAVVRGLG